MTPVAVSVSVIVTVRNEERGLAHLLESLVGQAHVAEVVLVDAASSDGTLAVAARFHDRLPLKVRSEPCTRGQGRNLGAAMATGDLLAFTDGDCVASAHWTEELLAAWRAAGANDATIVAGATVVTGYWAFTKLHRVELPHKGQDTTWPSCNLLYPRALFERLGGFDPTFVTAEDIDLNYRAVAAGAHIANAPKAIVYARARDSITGFLRQAYWNGYGRKQLTRKHGRLWAEYSMARLVRLHGGSVWGILRAAAGFFGYVDAKLGRPPAPPDAPQP